MVYAGEFVPQVQLRLTPQGGMQDELGPPALAFVKTVCAVLALDSAVDDQVAVLRRNLLKLVHVREFASASEFQVGLCSPALYPTPTPGSCHVSVPWQHISCPLHTKDACFTRAMCCCWSKLPGL